MFVGVSIFSGQSVMAFFLLPWVLCVLDPCDGYTNLKAPSFVDTYNINKLKQQFSPINIQVKNTKHLKLSPLVFSRNHWDSWNFFELNNTGELAVFRPTLTRKILTLSRGPLSSKYNFDSIHCHWHPVSDSKGTEHSINQNKFAMELHAVYYNQIYGSFENAKGKPDGLTIVSFIMKSVPGSSYNYKFDILSEAATKVRDPYTTTMVEYNVLLAFKEAALSRKYFHYYGSLTGSIPAPAKWIIFRRTVQISPDQVLPFREMLNPEGEPIFNIREEQFKLNTILYSVDSSLPCQVPWCSYLKDRF